MTALLRAEVRKLTATRSTWGMLAAALGIILLAVYVTLWGPAAGQLSVEGGPGELKTAADLGSLLGVTNLLGIFGLILGVIAATGEWRHQTAATTFLGAPQRGRVVVAKLGAVGLVGVLYAVAGLAMVLALGLLYTTLEGTGFPADGSTAGLVGLTVAGTALSTMLGVGIGAVVRSQVAAIVAVLVWLFVAESLVGSFLPDVARWLPFSAGGTVASSVIPASGLARGVAAAVSVGYVVVFGLAGIWLTERRDVV